MGDTSRGLPKPVPGASPRDGECDSKGWYYDSARSNAIAEPESSLEDLTRWRTFHTLPPLVSDSTSNESPRSAASKSKGSVRKKRRGRRKSHRPRATGSSAVRYG